MPGLPAAESPAPGQSQAGDVAVIIPARDEADRIAATVTADPGGIKIAAACPTKKSPTVAFKPRCSFPRAAAFAGTAPASKLRAGQMGRRG